MKLNFHRTPVIFLELYLSKDIFQQVLLTPMRKQLFCTARLLSNKNVSLLKNPVRQLSCRGRCGPITAIDAGSTVNDKS